MAAMDELVQSRPRNESALSRAWIRGTSKTAIVCAAVIEMLYTGAVHAIHVDFHVFNDRASYSAVLLQQGRVQLDADWYEEGTIQNDDAFGNFRFVLNADDTALAGVPGIVSGLAIGSASGEGTLGGDDKITLKVTPGTGVTAFGAIIAFDDPSFRNYFRLVLECPDGPCIFTPDPPDPASEGPGTLFLGVIAEPGFAFDTVRLEAPTPRDAEGEPMFSVPGWQLTGITAVSVPEPGTLALLGVGLAALAISRRRSRSLDGAHQQLLG